MTLLEDIIDISDCKIKAHIFKIILEKQYSSLDLWKWLSKEKNVLHMYSAQKSQLTSHFQNIMAM